MKTDSTQAQFSCYVRVFSCSDPLNPQPIGVSRLSPGFGWLPVRSSIHVRAITSSVGGASCLRTREELMSGCYGVLPGSRV